MTPEQRHELYKVTFGIDPAGKRILEDLATRFYDCPLFVSGGAEGERATAFKLGARSVVEYIMRQAAERET